MIRHSASLILRLSNDFLMATIKAKAKEKLIQVKSNIQTTSHPLPAAGQSKPSTAPTYTICHHFADYKSVITMTWIPKRAQISALCRPPSPLPDSSRLILPTFEEVNKRKNAK
jgi:hypothetical protein